MYRGSHLPVLMKVVAMTTGPILELGCGAFSTPILHWSCFPTRRRLVTYENHPAYYADLLEGVAENKRNIQNDFHEVHLITDWLALDLAEPWSVVFVDHSSEHGRCPEIQRVTHAEYVVVHDTERDPGSVKLRQFQREVLPLFKYRFEYATARPATTILSNVHDLAEFRIP
jgi:hypothetical protein